MHDLTVRILTTLLVGGASLLLMFFLFRVVYPRRVAAATPSHVVSTKDYGYLSPVARPLEWTLRQVEKRATRDMGRSSWGWAIVVTTFGLNLMLLPFRILAARNGKVMRALQPQMDAINARYKRKGAGLDSGQAREISELYRMHKTSPLAGCLPALAPFVILVAFYSVLTGMPEFSGARWLWIADLSKPEASAVHILPVLMIASQLLLAKITPLPASADPRMARVLALMPLIMGIVLYQQPSALVLYWLTGNLLQLLQQCWLGRRYA